MQEDYATWSSVLIVGDNPPWTQKTLLSMRADRLHRTQQNIVNESYSLI